MRIFLGFLVAAISLAAAVYLHSGLEAKTITYSDGGFVKLKAPWQDIFVAVAGVGAGLAIVWPAMRRA